VLFNLLQSFSMWTYNTPPAQWVRGSEWAFAILEVVHLFGLTILLGSILMLTLRVLGLTMRKHPVRQVAGELTAGTVLGLALVLFSGSLMFVSGAARYYISGPFQIKMVCFLAANIVHFTVYFKAMRSTEMELTSRWTRLMSGVALLLWIAVGAAGRAIAFI
jgi:hypothetical protein